MTSQLALDFVTPMRRPRTGRERRNAAVMKLQSGNGRWLTAVRELAHWYVGLHGSVTADDLAPYVERLRIEHGVVSTSKNAMGAVFATREWEWTGQWIKSERAHMHATDLRVWRLKS